MEERARHALLTDHAERCAYWPQFKGLMVAVDKGCQRSCLDAFGAPIKAQRQCAYDFDAHKIWPPRMWSIQRQDDLGE